jgi:glutamyl/glutaminyl-tRNA synthetase
MNSGYEPEALLNFIMLLGWSPPDGREVCSFLFVSAITIS